MSSNKWAEDRRKVREAIAEFPKEFSVRRFPDKRFTLVEEQSYMDDEGRPQLYVFIYDPEFGREGEDWHGFAKATPEELRREIITCRCGGDTCGGTSECRYDW